MSEDSLIVRICRVINDPIINNRYYVGKQTVYMYYKVGRNNGGGTKFQIANLLPIHLAFLITLIMTEDPNDTLIKAAPERNCYLVDLNGVEIITAITVTALFSYPPTLAIYTLDYNRSAIPDSLKDLNYFIGVSNKLSKQRMR